MVIRTTIDIHLVPVLWWQVVNLKYKCNILQLWTNFGPFNIKADAENELEWFKMCNNQKVAKYIVSFQQLSSKVKWGDTGLHCQFYNELPSHIKDKIANWTTLTNSAPSSNLLMPAIENVTEINHENTASSSKADKSDKSAKPNSQMDNRKNNSSSNNIGI